MKCHNERDPSVTEIFIGWLLMAAFVIFVVLAFAREARCQVTWAGPRPTPAEAAAVLRECSACLSNAANWPAPWPEGPTVVIVGSRPGAAAWLDFPAPSPRIRLDGTPIWLPPAIYGGRGLRFGHERFLRPFSSTILAPDISISSTPRRR